MAEVYVRSGAAGAGTGADWANAYTTLNAALTAKAAGDNFWVSEDHVESTAGAVTHTSPGTVSNPCFIYCVDHAGSVPPVAADLRTTASISSTGNTIIAFVAYAYCYGIIFQAGSGAVSNRFDICSSAANHHWRFDACQFRIVATGSSANITIGTAGANASKVVFNNTTVKFAAAGQTIVPQGSDFRWYNTASAVDSAGTIPTTLFSGNGRPGSHYLEGVDLSALGSGKTIVGAIAMAQKFLLKDCKLGASVTVAATPTQPGGAETIVIRTDSAGVNTRQEKYQYMGTQVVETTIVRTGGATDGSTPISWNITTTANSKWFMPFEALPIVLWNESTSAITLTVYGVWGGGAVPNNDEIWMDVEYLGASTSPLGSFATTTKASNLAAASAVSSDSSTWGGSTTAFKMAATFTPAMKGPITVHLRAAKATSTFYIDPTPVITGIATPRSYVLAPGVYANEQLNGFPRSRLQLGH